VKDCNGRIVVEIALLPWALYSVRRMDWGTSDAVESVTELSFVIVVWSPKLEGSSARLAISYSFCCTFHYFSMFLHREIFCLWHGNQNRRHQTDSIDFICLCPTYGSSFFILGLVSGGLVIFFDRKPSGCWRDKTRDKLKFIILCLLKLCDLMFPCCESISQWQKQYYRLFCHALCHQIVYPRSKERQNPLIHCFATFPLILCQCHQVTKPRY